MILNSGIWIQNHRKWFWIQGFEFKIAEYDIEFRDLNSKSQNLILNSVIWIQNHRLWYFEFRESVVWIQGHNRLQAQIFLLSWKFMIEHHIIHMHIYDSMCSCSVWYTCKVLVYTSPVECSHVITACKWWAAANGSGKPVYHWRHYFGWWWRCSSHRFWIWCASQMGITMYTSHLHIAFASLCSGRWLAFASFCSGLWFCPTEGYCLYRLLKDMPMLQHHLQNQLLVAAIFFDFCKNILRCNWRFFF